MWVRPHHLKNTKSRIFGELTSVPREFCLLLTGTLLQNYTEKLWALLKFSDSDTFDSKEALVEKFGQLTDAKQVSDLYTVLTQSINSERGCEEATSS